MKNIFGTSGIRGILGHTHTINDIIKAIYSIDEFFKGNNVLIGWDCRIHSYPLAIIATSLLSLYGKDVSIGGVISTPSFQTFLKKKKEFDYGLMFTASHNPPEYFGIKVFDNRGVEITTDTEMEISKIFHSFQDKLQLEWIKSKPYFSNITEEIVNEYINQVNDLFPNFPPEIYNLKLAVDYANCSNIKTAGTYLSNRFSNIIHINDILDGRFPGRPPEPKPDNIIHIVKKLIGKIDLGVAFDGDGDRGMIFDGHGNIYWGDEIGFLVAHHLKEELDISAIVTPISSSLIIENVLNEDNIKIIWTKVGAKNVVKKMIENNINFGFEENGGLIYLPHIAGRDGLVTLLFTLRILEKTKKTISEIREEFPKTYTVKRNVRVKGNKHLIFDILKEKILSKYKDTIIDYIEIDGVKLILGRDRSALIRPSGTEPIIRIFTESNNYDDAKNLNLEIEKIVKNIEGEMS